MAPATLSWNSCPVVPRIMGTAPHKGNTEAKVPGITLNVRGQEHLHFDSMKRTLVAQVPDPQGQKCQITVTVPFFIRRDAINKTLTTVQRDETWGWSSISGSFLKTRTLIPSRTGMPGTSSVRTRTIPCESERGRANKTIVGAVFRACK